MTRKTVTISLTFLMLVCADTRQSHAEPPAPVSSQVFEDTLGLSQHEFDRRVRRLRSFGWSFFGLSSLALFAAVGTQGHFDSFGAPILLGAGVGGALLLTSATLLLRARVLVIRRRRFREQQAALDRSYFHPEVDIGIAPSGLSLHLSF